MNTIEVRTVQGSSGCVIYTLERKEVKNFNLRVRKDGSVYVSANMKATIERIDEFVLSKSAFIANAQGKFREMEQLRPAPKQYVSGETFYIQGRSMRLQVIPSGKDTINSDGVYIRLRVKDIDDFQRKERLVKRFLHNQCVAIFSQTLDQLYPLFEKYGIARPVLRIRDMETRWGSCLAKKGIITLNMRLLEAPQNCIEYVVMHELCHFIHPNHSRHFYSFLAMLMPDWKERKRSLDNAAAHWV